MKILFAGILILAGFSGFPPSVFAAETPSSSNSALEAIMSEEFIRGLRDPFQAPTELLKTKEQEPSELELFRITDFRLNGVITGPKKVRAMVTTPNNKSYFIKVGDAIGVRSGRVAQISSDSVRVTEYTVDEKGKRVAEQVELKITGENQDSKEGSKR